jgi:hypothetical protein
MFLFKQNQDQQAKETQKALQTMSSMSSAQIVSATAMHNKAAAAAGLATLGLGTTVPYPGAVSAQQYEIFRLSCFLGNSRFVYVCVCKTLLINVL